jgi:hypothetical protein
VLADEKEPPLLPPTKTADSQSSFRNNLPLISACFVVKKTLQNMVCHLRCRNMRYTVIFIVVLIPVLKTLSHAWLIAVAFQGSYFH